MIVDNELKLYKQEEARIKEEIKDLESKIIVEGRRNNRYEVNNYRNRKNGLKMKLEEISLKVEELEKMSKKTNSLNKIQNLPAAVDLPEMKNGEITITDKIEFDRGYSDIGGEIIQTVNRTIKKKITFKNNQPVSYTETANETVTTRRLRDADSIYVKSSVY